MSSLWPVHGKISGPIVLIGFGSIGRGILPLIERHFDFDKSRFTVIDPSDANRHLLDVRGISFLQKGLTRENYRDVLTPLLTKGPGQGFIVNLSVEVCSLDIIKLAQELGKLPNKVSIEGHTDSKPFAAHGNYGNWELSTDRANMARRLMQGNGIGEQQVTQVRGYADQRLRKPADPTDPSNRRISVIVQYPNPALQPAAAPPPEVKSSAPAGHK